MKPAGSNHILQVLKGRKALCSINSGPYVPWLTKEDLKRWTKGAEWQTGPIKVEGLGEVSLQVENWAEVPKPRQLVLLAKGRLVRVMAKEWTPELGAILSGITFVEGADRRTAYREKVGITAEEAKRGVSPELALDLRGLHGKLGEDYEEFTNDVTKKGFVAFEAGKLDTLEALLLRDKLASALQKAVADRQTRPKEGEDDRYKQHSSGATPSHATPPSSSRARSATRALTVCIATPTATWSTGCSRRTSAAWSTAASASRSARTSPTTFRSTTARPRRLIATTSARP